MTNVTDGYWKGVKVHESSNSESGRSYDPIHDFNFDSKYLVEVQDLPHSASRQDIVDFFQNVNILNGPKGIHFVLDETDGQSGHAYIQLAQLGDFKLAQEFNRKYMDGNRISGKFVSNFKNEDEKREENVHENIFISVMAADSRWFNDKMAKRKLPSKDSCVFLTGLPQSFKEEDIEGIFHGI